MLQLLGNLPSMSGRGKLEQTSQFSRTMCDCKTGSKNSNQLLEDETFFTQPAYQCSRFLQTPATECVMNKHTIQKDVDEAIHCITAALEISNFQFKLTIWHKVITGLSSMM